MPEQFCLKATGANSYLRMVCVGRCLTQICQQTLFDKFLDVKTMRQLVLEAFDVSSCHFVLGSLLENKMCNLFALITRLPESADEVLLSCFMDVSDILLRGETYQTYKENN